jgi:hypothetical protein
MPLSVPAQAQTLLPRFEHSTQQTRCQAPIFQIRIGHYRPFSLLSVAP